GTGKRPAAGACAGTTLPRSSGPTARRTTQPEAASSLEESWPSTESSSLVTAESEEDGQSRAGIAGGSPTSPEVLRADTDWSASPNNAPMDSSIIAKYIQRFRHGQPLSREHRERAHSTESTEFWWLNNSPPSNSTPTQDTEHISQGIRPLSTGGGVFGGYSPSQLTRFRPLPGRASLPSPSHPSVALLRSGLSSGGERSDVSQLEPFDQETIHLQERTSHLLERSESSSSGPAAVSSDGVGSPSVSGTIEEVSLRPPSTPLYKPTAAHPYLSDTSLQGGAVTVKQVPSAPACLHLVRVPAFSPIPEDDILYQWRLQRKMEAARESPWPLLSKGKSHSPSICLNRSIAECNEEADEDRVRAMVPSLEGYWRRAANPARPPTHCVKTVTGADVSKAMLNPNRREPISTEPPSVHGPVCPQPAREHQHSDPDFLDRGQGGDRGPDSLTASVDTGQSCAESLARRSYPEGGWHPAGAAGGKPSGQVARPERCPCSATEQRGHRYQHGCDKAGQDKSSTGSSTLPLPRTPGDPTPQQDTHSLPGQGHPASGRYQTELGQESRSDEAWIPLPEEMGMVRRAGRTQSRAQSNLQHVLGQVVSERMFSPVSKQPSSKKPKIGSRARAHRLPTSPIPSNRQTPEIVTQLLEEAEESDGVEFEEDILLQVLRQQRDWVKEQLREADSRLTVLNEHKC
ncbi:proline and serine-rich protein 3, partial [Mustelus asterias]